jgi:hypothetical protein
MAAIPPNQSIKNALSVARVQTYELATTVVPPIDGAISLYTWNARISSAFLDPLHVCEVVVRNAVSEALETIYGANWPWDNTFLQSLPNPNAASGVFNPRKELLHVRNKHTSTGKVIADLKFVFWQKMFTKRFDIRVWDPLMNTVFPFLPTGWTVRTARKEIYSALEQLRGLRNRIAHHEPIFTRGLAGDFQKTLDLINYRCPVTSAWMLNNQQVTPLIGTKPP